MSDIVACPYCARKLRVPPDLQGMPVKCPACLKSFEPPAAPDALDLEVQPPANLPLQRAPRDRDHPPPPPPKRAARLDRDDEDDDDPPRRRSRYDDEDDDDRPRRRRRRYADEHRGGMILALGICALMGFFTPITGPMAWIMGSGDLGKIRRGRMDPEGESLTRTGMYLGMAATILMVLLIILICGVMGLVVVTG